MKKSEKYTLDWSAALQGNEDWNAAMDSEIFRIFAAAELKKEYLTQKEERDKAEKELKDKFDADHKKIMDRLDKADKDSKVPDAIISNFPIGDFQEHVKERQGKIATAQEKDELKEEILEVEETPAEEKIEEKKEETEAPKEEVLTTITTDTSPVVKKQIKVKRAPVKKEEDLYHTNAGESKHINVGLTEETMKSMKENAVHEAAKEVMEVFEKAEIKEAEEGLGLNKNIAYLISTLKVRG